MKRRQIFYILALVLFVVAVVAVVALYTSQPTQPEYDAGHPDATSPDLKANIVNGWLPDPNKTPGDTIAGVTAEMVAQPGYAKNARNVPESEKERVYQIYGIKYHSPGEYEVDHLISLEIGGSNSIRNLWPQPYHGAWNAHQKDRLENKLHQLVIRGQITLPEAQRAIATNWIEAYKKYVVAEQ